MIFRKALMRVRRMYYTDLKRSLALALIGFVALGAASVALDIILPFESWFNFIRSALLIPLSLIVFMLGYWATCWRVDAKRALDPEYMTLREKISPMWRRRFAVIAAAVALLLAYTSMDTVGMTISGSFVVALVIGAVTFARMTTTEKKRESIGVPDKRDLAYNSNLEERRRKRELAKEEAELVKSARRERLTQFRGLLPFRSSRKK